MWAGNEVRSNAYTRFAALIVTYIAQVITSETHGANAYHLSLLANVKDPHVRALIPVDTTLSTVTATSPDIPQV